MADLITTLPAKITSVDTSEHEIQIDPSVFSGASPVQLAIEVVTGTITLSKGKAKSGGSASFTASTNPKTILTLKHGGQSIFYTATTTGDAFIISE